MPSQENTRPSSLVDVMTKLMIILKVIFLSCLHREEDNEYFDETVASQRSQTRWARISRTPLKWMFCTLFQMYTDFASSSLVKTHVLVYIAPNRRKGIREKTLWHWSLLSVYKDRATYCQNTSFHSGYCKNTAPGVIKVLHFFTHKLFQYPLQSMDFSCESRKRFGQITCRDLRPEFTSWFPSVSWH